MKNVSIILTIHDKDFLIKQVLKGILDNKSEHTKELFLIFDYCTDESEKYSKEILKNVKDINVIYEYADDLFETKCNNIGLKKSTCTHSLIIQDDMVVAEKDFDKRMLKPYMFPDSFAVTSRLAHNDTLINGQLYWRDLIGYDPYNIRILPAVRDYYFIRDICNRGPLMLDNEKTQKLNYLDEIYAPFTLDDHDICFRAWKQFGWVSGSFWTKWNSKDEWGGTRKNDKIAKIMDDAELKNRQTLINRYQDLMQPNNKHNQQRYIL